MLENNPQEHRLASIFQRLESYAPSSPQKRILQKLESPTLLVDVQTSFKDFKNHKNKESLQENLTAYLFSLNRQLYKENGGENYDLEKEKRQIEAVSRALKGEHIHMGTGEGKSTVVLPITAIVEALTSENKNVIIASTDETKLEIPKKKR
jgi:hypothetical protein